MNPSSTIIQELLALKQATPDDVLTIRKKVSQQFGLAHMPSNAQIIKAYFEEIKKGTIIRNKHIEQLLRKRAIRSQSGIVPVQVLTKPFWCPGECIFCPNDATMPKSYINTEPGAQRALLNNFDPYKQVFNRLISLTLTGHETDKIEMIVLGGTRDVYPKEYKISFVKGLYDACNNFDRYFQEYISKGNETQEVEKLELRVEDESFIGEYPATIEESIKLNETAECRIIGLTIETRPEYVTDENCQLWRNLGVTRIEMGIQNMFDEVLEANKRGHTIEQCKQAMFKLRQYAFKVSVHLMPGLYKSTIEKDTETFRIAFEDFAFRPDELKFYPTAVIPNTELFNLYKKGEYKPLTQEQNSQIIKKVLKEYIPPYTRIKRLIRDIPAEETVGTEYVTNLRQLVENQLQDECKNMTNEQRIQYYSRLYENTTAISDQNQLNILIKEQLQIINNNQATVTYLPKSIQLNLSEYRGFVCFDTRSREIRNNLKSDEVFPVIRSYTSSNGLQLFISFEDSLGFLYGFTRLQLGNPDSNIDYDGLGKNTALIRELHVYGQVAKIGSSKDDKTQHQGIGSQLMELAEQISQYCNYDAISVISGVGVRKYYEKLGYKLEGTYLKKYFN